MLRRGVWVTLGQPMLAADMPPVFPTRLLWGLAAVLCVFSVWSIAQSVRAEAPPSARAPTTQVEPEKELVVQAVEKKPGDARYADPAQELDYLALADAPVFLPRSYLYWGSPTGPKGHRQP